MTLTFRGDVHPEAAGKRFHVWISRINRRLYGRGWHERGEGIRWVRTSEPTRRSVLHFHALIGGDDVDELRRLSWMDEWDKLAGFARIEAPRSGEAVRHYCAKYVVKRGEVDVGGPGMHEPPASRWPREWLPWLVKRKLAPVRDVVTAEEWRELQRWARSPRRQISGPGWCTPGFPTPPKLVAEVRARLDARAPLALWPPETGNGVPAAAQALGRAS